jgi:hypothetical protein
MSSLATALGAPQDARPSVLLGLGYPEWNITNKILPDLARDGTAQATPFVCNEHRDAVEAVLPFPSAWHWPVTVETDFVTYWTAEGAR